MVLSVKDKYTLMSSMLEHFGNQPQVISIVPARVDLMGSHTDYNLGRVMTMAIDRSMRMAGKKNQCDKIKIYSLDLQKYGEIYLDNLSYKLEGSWLKYIAGVVNEYQKLGYKIEGFDAVLNSTIPMASGLSSSAALEVAVATLIEGLQPETSLDKIEKVKLCQKAEVEYVGVKCGILDQYSVVMGVSDKTIMLDCKTNTHQYSQFPSDLMVVICNTKAPRQLATSQYGKRRDNCSEAYNLARAGNPEALGLCDISIKTFNKYRSEMNDDVEESARFILEENARVLALQKAFDSADRDAIGKLFRESYYGARDLFKIVNEPMEAMYDAMMSGPGILAARQAGAGFGGCMTAVVDRDYVGAFVDKVTSAYQRKTNIKPELYPVRPSMGASYVMLEENAVATD